jgi:flagellum-specific ATP synthase
MIDYARYHLLIEQVNPIRVHGKVTEIIGLVVEGSGPATSIGELCGIFPGGGRKPLPAEVVGFRV